MSHPPAYCDLPPNYDSLRRISPLDPAFTRILTFTVRAQLQPYFIVPQWAFPVVPAPDWYCDSKPPGWNAGIIESNRALKVLSSRQFNLIISHFFIFLMIIGLFFVAALGQRDLIQFANSRIIIPTIVVMLMVVLWLVSRALRLTIFSLDEPFTTAKNIVAEMGWKLQNFIPRLGIVLLPEIEIIRYESDLLHNSSNQNF